MKNSSSETTALRISRILADRIIRGDIPAGSKLRQDHVADEFASSHVPVREAFRLLEARGLAKSQPRRGVRVTSLDLDEINEVAEMRSVLEGLALRHAAPNLTPALLDEAETFNVVGEASDDVRVWEDANRKFHRTLLAPCGMPKLLASIDELHTANARYLFGTRGKMREIRPNEDHRAILAALRYGQTEAAVVMLARHVRWIDKHGPYSFS